MIVAETNCYTEQCMKSRGVLFPFRSRLRELIPVMINRLHITFALLMMMGIVQKLTSGSQFEKKCHYSNAHFWSCHITGPVCYPIIMYLSHKFETSYLPKQNISVEESLTFVGKDAAHFGSNCH
jgi:hypothetical protein